MAGLIALRLAATSTVTVTVAFCAFNTVAAATAATAALTTTREPIRVITFAES
jgi:hypothetical protein